MRVLTLSSSPRLDGNSRMLAEAVLEGAVAAGHEGELIDLSGRISGLLRDCRICRNPDGRCTIDDDYEAIFLERMLAADALVLGTPLYWYGVSGTLKTFIDRIFCFIADSYPDADRVCERLVGKRLVVAVAAEESYRGATIGVTASMQELARYLHWDLVAVLVGIGNRRGEVRHDPARPLDAAREAGRRLFEGRITDYRLDSDRPGSVWG